MSQIICCISCDVSPQLQVLAMGFSWALYFCQNMVESCVRLAAMPRDSICFGVYVDSVCVVGCNRTKVPAALEAVKVALDAAGLRCSEVETDTSKQVFTGLQLNHKTGVPPLEASRIWRLRRGLEYAARERDILRGIRWPSYWAHHLELPGASSCLVSHQCRVSFCAHFRILKRAGLARSRPGNPLDCVISAASHLQSCRHGFMPRMPLVPPEEATVLRVAHVILRRVRQQAAVHSDGGFPPKSSSALENEPESSKTSAWLGVKDVDEENRVDLHPSLSGGMQENFQSMPFDRAVFENVPSVLPQPKCLPGASCLEVSGGNLWRSYGERVKPTSWDCAMRVGLLNAWENGCYSRWTTWRWFWVLQRVGGARAHAAAASLACQHPLFGESSFLEQNRVTAATVQRCTVTLNEFLAFAKMTLDEVKLLLKLDEMVVEMLEHMYIQGYGHGAGGYLMAAVKFAGWIQSFSDLPRAMRALTRFRRLPPVGSPLGSSRRAETSKTAEFDESVLLDGHLSVALGKALTRYTAGTTAATLLWSWSQARYAVDFAKWAETSGVNVITTHPYSVRHG